jgi:hypothetical protein
VGKGCVAGKGERLAIYIAIKDSIGGNMDGVMEGQYDEGGRHSRKKGPLALESDGHGHHGSG